MTTWYLDLDGDGFGDPGWSRDSCERPSAVAVEDGSDCDDNDAGVFPGAAELCDRVDQDCDGDVDEDDVGGGWYADSDGDGWGDAQQPLASCDPAVGGSLDDSDCDDADAGQRWCLSCADLWERSLATDGVNTLSTATGETYEALCDEAWTLIATNTRSGTWNPSNVLDDSFIGSLSEVDDYKDHAWSSAPFTDLRFVNDQEYAIYADVGDGTLSWSAFQAAVPGANCGPDTVWSWELTEGNLSGEYLCSTDLHVHPSSWHEGECVSGLPGFGPTWSAWNASAPSLPCPLQLPHTTGFMNDDQGHGPFGADEGPLRMWVR